MLTVAEYCESRKISQTAIRRQLKRYAEDLQGHIVETKRGRLLDDQAVEFLDGHRRPREVIIEQADTEARKELEELRAKMDIMKDQLQLAREKIIDLQDERLSLIEYKARNQLLLEMREQEVGELRGRLEESIETTAEMRARTEIAEKRAEELEDRVEKAEKEAGRYVRSWFGLYKRKDIDQ